MKTANKKSTFKNTTSKNMQETFLNEVLAKIEAVNASDWEHYVKGKFDLAPRNAFTNYHYRRFNKINLMLEIVINQRKSALYATFKQISARGGLIKKGSKGHLIEYFSWMIKHKETKQNISMKEYLALTGDKKKEYAVYPISKFYRVFNLEDVDTTNMNFDLPESELDEEEEITLDNNIESFVQSVVDNKGLIIEEKFSGVASYSPSSDKITMPNKEICVSMDRYYSTLFHEMIHWTGSADRLNRLKGTRFGDSKYAFEELVAEMGSMLLCLDYNINSEFINSLRYLKGWSRATINKDVEFKNALIFSQSAIAFLTK